MRISKGAMAEIEQALREYENEVDDTRLTRITRITYKRGPRDFVRWLKGEFTPGERV